MIFTIASINKSIDLYEVISNTNERQMVTAVQITMVLANGYEFTNAYLTRKGFAIKTPNGTRYVQINNMSKELERAVLARLKYLKDMEEAKKQQMTAAIRKPVATVKKPTAKIGNGGKPTPPSNSRNDRIVYKGEIFFSRKQLCKKYNRDLDTFNKLYAIGYSIEECLGLMPLRPESEVTPREKIEKMIDRLEAQHGGI